MKLLLTSGGIRNPSLQKAVIDLLGKPISDAHALCIPTASYGNCNPEQAFRFITGQSQATMTGLGWKSLGVLELTALPSLEKERWVKWVKDSDILLVDGGDALYLNYWLKQSGLAELLPSLGDKVWVGLSAGSMVMTPRIGEDFVTWRSPVESDGDKTLGIVDFSLFPHLEEFPENSMADAERWAASIRSKSYAIDDQSAIKVVNGVVEVVSEGKWKFFDPT